MKREGGEPEHCLELSNRDGKGHAHLKHFSVVEFKKAITNWSGVKCVYYELLN